MNILDLLRPVEPSREDAFLAAARTALLDETPEAIERVRVAAIGLEPDRVRELVRLAGRQARHAERRAIDLAGAA